MEKQKEEARRAWKGSGEAATEDIWFEVKEEVGATEFLGYDAEQAEAVIKGTFASGKPVKVLAQGETGEIVVNQTPFYGESGGQVGDTGVIKGPKGARLPRHRHAEEARRAVRALWHGRGGLLQAGRPGRDGRRPCQAPHRDPRQPLGDAPASTRRLRQMLGTHVAQKGSLVSPDRLRFDISHTKPMAPEEIATVEAMANAYVLQNSARRDAPDEPRGCPRDGRDGALRREVRRRGARRLDGCRRCAARRPTSRGRSSCAAARTCAARVTSASSASSARARRQPASAASRPSRRTAPAPISPSRTLA